jgi:DNA-binding CsgD family transcriptional regulator
VAAQLVAVPPAADPAVVETLRSAAREALARGAPDSGMAYLRRALLGAPPAADRGELLFELGSAEALTAGPQAAEHLAEALELTRDPRRGAMVAVALARTLIFTGRAPEAVEVVRRAMDRLGDADAELRQRLEAVLFAPARLEPELVEIRDELTARMRRGVRPDGDGYGVRALAAVLAWFAANTGEPAGEAVAWARQALAGGLLLERDNGGADFMAAVIVLALADSELALETLEAALEVARERGDAFAVAADKIFLCQVHLFRGELADAVADGEEGLTASEAYGIVPGLPSGSAFLAGALMEQGDLEGAERTLARASTAEEVPDHAIWYAFLDSRALLRMLRGDLRGAIADSVECGRRAEAIGMRNPAFMAWRSRAALCLAELGEEPERARALAEEDLRLARAWGAPRALGVALRAKGLVLGGEEGVRLLRDAVAALDGSPARLEHARALVELGAAMRRAGSRADAREPLKAGLSLARHCGAVPLVERAYDELSAAGARPRKIVRTGTEALTASERRVARLAASGMTNREIAQSLFVTIKTVEFHLGQAYRKLGISSREQLGPTLGEEMA